MRDYKYIPEALPNGSLIDPYEVYGESPNPAIRKIAAAQRRLSKLSEKEFLRGLPEVLDIVCKHFGIKKGATNA